MTTSAWDNPALTGGLGERIATDLRDMVLTYENSRERSVQTHIGPSEIGKPCTRCLARHALGAPIARDARYSDPWCAIIGTAVHAWLDKAAQHSNTQAGEEWWLTETRVQPHPDAMPKGGNADLYDVVRKCVIDHKVVSADRLRSYRLNGPGVQYRRQAHLYGLGFHRLGKPVEHVAVAFWQRGGRLKDLYVWTEPFDPQIALDAINRYQTIAEQAAAIGPAILPLLPADSDCFDCGGKDVTPEELAALATPQPGSDQPGLTQPERKSA